ncbi:hypothetical protein BSKO_00884 [Bryopsis sp. KO-2023]|nr:hypothetical protein BSKO_00884 [Bryopsis sp. KO-2023]
MKTPSKTWKFSIVICQNAQGKFLAVDESRNRGWWVPGGFVEPGESFEEAAIRETREEAGIEVVLTGVLRVEHTPLGVEDRMRVIFAARPQDEDQVPKSVADDESNGAAWVTLDEFLSKPKNRGMELVQWGKYIEDGGPIFPLTVFAMESDDVPKGREVVQTPGTDRMD